jgi:HemY protein
MLKFLLWLALLVIVVLGAVLLVRDDPGFLLIRYGDWSLETSLAVGIVAVIAGSLLVMLGFRLLLWLWRLPRAMKRRRRQRRMEKARKLTGKGLLDLAEGRFEQSEQNLLKLIDAVENPLINYLAAARAAQQQGRYDQRDEYLKSAHETNPEAEIAIGVTQAELQLAAGQTERALATLTHLRHIAPKHDYVLKLLARVYFQIEEWSKLCELLPEVRKKQLFRSDKLEGIELKAYTGCLNEAARLGGDALDRAWSKIPKAIQSHPDLLLRYIDLVEQYHQDSRQVEQIVVKAINQKWNPRLVDFYGRLESADGNAQLATAEKWLQEYGSSDVLLLALGRICKRLRLWGKAQSYLEASIGIKPTAEACLELAELLGSGEVGESDKACSFYQQGLRLCLEPAS